MAETWSKLREQARHLGEVRAEFSATSGKRMASMAWAILILTLGGMGIIIGLTTANLSPRNRPPNPEGDRIGRILFVGGGSFIFIVGMGLLWSACRAKGNGILVLRDGLCVWRSGRTITCGWDEIEEAWWKEHLADSNAGLVHKTLWLHLRDGQKLKCGNTVWVFPQFVMGEADLEQLRAVVEQETIQRRLPNLVKALASGAAASFGKLLVTRDGVKWKGNAIAWDRVRGIQPHVPPLLPVGPYRWSLMTDQGSELTLSLNRIPNLGLFWTLANELHKGADSVSNAPPL